MITQEFKQYVQNKNVRRVRMILKNSLLVDPTFLEFNEMLLLAERGISDLYDDHDGEQLNFQKTTWNKQYLDQQMIKVVNNFSRERIQLLKNICSYLYSDKVCKIESERKLKVTKNSYKKPVGVGLGVIGAGVVVAGVVVAKTTLVVAGATVVLSGGALIVSDKIKNVKRRR